MITKKNLRNHEFIGLPVQVNNLKGTVIDETKNTFVVQSQKGEKVIPKQGNIFNFKIGQELHQINGSEIKQRPFERLKKKFKVKNKWEEILE